MVGGHGSLFSSAIGHWCRMLEKNAPYCDSSDFQKREHDGRVRALLSLHEMGRPIHCCWRGED